MALEEPQTGNLEKEGKTLSISAEKLNQIANGTDKQPQQQQQQRNNKQNDINTAFLRAARAGDLQKLIEYLETGQVTDINTCNANGLNALHLAAKDGHYEIVNELLKRGANVDNATKKGNTALHIASLAGQKDIIQLLLQYNASVNVQSQNGFTPLYMAAQENHDECVNYLLAKGANPALATEDGFTPLAVAMQQGHDKVVAVLLESDTRGKVRLPALHIAAKKDDVKAATLLLENEHNPDVSSKSGFTPLHIAAHYGNVNVAKLLIDKGADVNFTAKHNITPLHVACKWGKLNMVSLLIKHNAKIDSITRDGLTPLHCAARSGHDQVIELLLENNAEIIAKTKNGLAPLHMAAQGEHVNAARILLLNKSPVDDITIDYLTALHVAAHCGHVKVAKLLLDRNADPNARALNGFTPLHIACKKNRIKVVELLLKHGATIGATTESGLTPLHVASFMGCMSIVIYLMQHDASPDIPTVRGETPLHLAARAKQTDIIRILLRNGANVDAKAREDQTPLHVASRIGNVDIVMLLLQHGAKIDSVTKDNYTPLHIAAKEGQDDVVTVLLDNKADIEAITKKGFTPLHLASKYGNLKCAELLLDRGAKIDIQGKNGVTPLHVASHYDHQKLALLLLERGASLHAAAKNGHTPLHIAAKKNQMDIAQVLLEYKADPNAESKSGFTPLHLAAQEGHQEMTALLLEYGANANHAAKNGLTALHLCAQEDHVPIARALHESQCNLDPVTKSGYTPLHVGSHFGQINIVKFLLENDANIEASTNIGYTPLHQAAQQGHTLIINILLKNKANPNAVTHSGQTALSIADKLGYITVVETLKVVTETKVEQNVDEKIKIVLPETIHETFMTDSEDEGEDPIMSDHQQYNYMTSDENKPFDDSMNMTNMSIDPSKDEKCIEKIVSSAEKYMIAEREYSPNPLDISVTDNAAITRKPIHVGFLVSFLVDARGGAMRGCRHSGVRVIVPPRSAAQPTRITCRYVRTNKIQNPPPLMEGEGLVSRILELAPIGAKFLGPVILEVPHFASLREKEREIIILRSDNGDTWREHTLYDSEEAIHDVLNETFKGDTLNFLEDLHTNRITRILTNDFPHYFAIVSRIRQEVHAIGPEGGTVSASAVPQVQAIFPQNALTKKIRVGLQAQPVDSNLTATLLGRSVAVSPVVTVEPRRRKFHKAITLSMPAPKAYNQNMINQYSGNAPTLRLLCSITGGQNRAVWEDVTGSTPLTFVNECVSFTTTVSARFWLMDCRNISEATKMATDLYANLSHVPFMVKFVVFAKRLDQNEAKLSVFCMTDDKEDKTLEHQEHFIEIAKSRDIEVSEGKSIYLEFSGNIVPVLKTGDQLHLQFNAFKENRMTFLVKIKNDMDDLLGKIAFMGDPKVAKGELSQVPMCTLSFTLPPERNILADGDMETASELDHSSTEVLNYDSQFVISAANRLKTGEPILMNGDVNEIHKADIKITDICNLLGSDWPKLASELQISQTDIDLIKNEYPEDNVQQSTVMLRLWLRQAGKDATGNVLEHALFKIERPDIVNKSISNLELVTDENEKELAKKQLESTSDDGEEILTNGEKCNTDVEESPTEKLEADEKQEHELDEKSAQKPISDDILDSIKEEIEKMAQQEFVPSVFTVEPVNETVLVKEVKLIRETLPVKEMEPITEIEPINKKVSNREIELIEKVEIIREPLMEMDMEPVEEVILIKETLPVNKGVVELLKETVPLKEAEPIKEAVPVKEIDLIQEVETMTEFEPMKEMEPIEEIVLIRETVPVNEVEPIKETLLVEEEIVIIRETTPLKESEPVPVKESKPVKEVERIQDTVPVQIIEEVQELIIKEEIPSLQAQIEEELLETITEPSGADEVDDDSEQDKLEASADMVEVIRRIRRESAHLGIEVERQTEDGDTPPSTPAEKDMSPEINVYEPVKATTTTKDHQIQEPNIAYEQVAKDVQEIIHQAIKDYDTEDDDDEDDDDDDDDESFEYDKEGKVRTIKKHSKVNMKIHKEMAHRPKIDNIEWSVPQLTVEEEGLLQTKEISSINLEDVSNNRRYSLDNHNLADNIENITRHHLEQSISYPEDKSEQIVIISSDNNVAEMSADYSGDIDEFIFVQASPVNFGKTTEGETSNTDDDDNSNLVIITEEADIDENDLSSTNQSSKRCPNTSSDEDNDEMYGTKLHAHILRSKEMNDVSINHHSNPIIAVEGQTEIETETNNKTIGSSSGSDIALREDGGELSDDDDETENDLNQANDQFGTVTTTTTVIEQKNGAETKTTKEVEEFVDENEDGSVKKIITTTTTTISSSGEVPNEELQRKLMEAALESGNVPKTTKEVAEVVEENEDGSVRTVITTTIISSSGEVSEEPQRTIIIDQPRENETKTTTEVQEVVDETEDGSVMKTITTTTKTISSSGDVPNEELQQKMMEMTLESGNIPKTTKETAEIVEENEDGSVRRIITTTIISSSGEVSEEPQRTIIIDQPTESETKTTTEVQEVANETGDGSVKTITTTTTTFITSSDQFPEKTIQEQIEAVKSKVLSNIDPSQLEHFSEGKFITEIIAPLQESTTTTTTTTTHPIESKIDPKSTVNSIVDFINEERKN